MTTPVTDESCPLPWLYLHFPCLQLDQLLELEPEQPESNQKPLIIVNSKTNQIKQLNKGAFEQGIKVNMGIATAIALAPDLMVLDYQIECEIKQLEALAGHLYQITADIVLYLPNGLLLQVEPMLNLYGSFKNYWRNISQVLHKSQYHYTWALAATPTAARLLAKYDSALQNPFNKEKVNQALGRLSVTCLEINPKHIEQLQRLGLHHIEQLWGLSTKSIGRRFGLELVNYLQQLKQHNPTTFTNSDEVKPYQLPQRYSHSIELLYEINQTSVLLFPLKRMIQKMENFLLTRQLLVHEIFITLHYRQLAATKLTIASSEGEYQTEPWMRLIALKVEQCQLPDSVIVISIECGALVKKQRYNQSLFNAANPIDSTNDSNQEAQSASQVNNKLTPNQLVSILEAKVGKSHLFTLTLKDDHRPEYATSYQSTSSQSTSYQPESDKKNLLAGHLSIPIPWQRPTLLLKQPQPLPAGFHIIAGPERICSAWWQQNPYIDYAKSNNFKDYYIAKDSFGTLCWIYHQSRSIQGYSNENCSTQSNGEWFIQGYFC